MSTPAPDDRDIYSVGRLNAEARALLDRAGIAYAPDVVLGPVAASIAQYAKDNACQQIVMGTRGLGAIGGFYAAHFKGASPSLFSMDSLMLMLAMIVLHVGAAMKHWLMDGDGVLESMLPFMPKK